MAMTSGLANAATLSSASVSLSDPRPGAASVKYNLAASSFSGGTIKCIKEVFSTTPSGSTKPTNMVTASGITIDASQTLVTTPGSWTRGGADADGTVTFTNSGSTDVPSGTKSFVLAGFTNSTVADTSFWVKFSTYGNIDCTSSPVDNATVGFLLTNGSTLSLTVDQTLAFTVNPVASGIACDGGTTTQASTATTIPFGTVTAASNGFVCQDLTAATNATNGYTIYARYTGKPANALSQTIADASGSNTTPATFTAAGTEAYGYTTSDATLGTGTVNRFTSPSQAWAAMTASNSEIAYEPTGVTNTTYHIGHQVGISLTTKPGTYQTTVIYTCTPLY